jgi:2-polyprenyl-6-methoxyphenol hydroxylase-like FAD-dependent oxidoreductase
LIEKAPRLRTDGYVIDFWGVGYTIAERMGVLPEVLKAGYSFRELCFVDKRGRNGGGFSTDVFRRITNGRFTSLPRGDLAGIIYRTIENYVETVFDDFDLPNYSM